MNSGSSESFRQRVDLSEAVQEARLRGRPLVALESTLVTHGLPWPDNLATAQRSEAAVRERGAVPATIAVLGGRIRVGLEPWELESLARGATPLKASRRDLAIAVAGSLNAATTVAATLWIARRMGIEVMATGGLGGVHRDWCHTGDISNDLDELSRGTGTVVVCSGAKAILDLPATLERLETLGVAILGYGTSEWPAFMAARSGIRLEHRVDTAAAVAAVQRAHRELGLPGAIILAQPPPPDVALERTELDACIERAVFTAKRDGISGKKLTPYLLDAIRQDTCGRSVRANQELIVANASLAAEVACQV